MFQGLNHIILFFKDQIEKCIIFQGENDEFGGPVQVMNAWMPAAARSDETVLDPSEAALER